MADRDGVDFATTERVLATGGVSKRRRNLSNKTGGDRLKSTQSKSPKRRPGTPEPEKRVFSDDSERETSDSETVRRSGGRVRDRAEIILRARSKERPPKKDTTTEIEDDFEIIRRMHQVKQAEESSEETKKEKFDAVPISKDLKRDREVKEMPPLILSPPAEEKPKRARPKTLPLKEEIPTAKPRARSRSRPRRLSTSEEDDEANLALKGKLVLKPKQDADLKNELRRRKLIAKKPVEHKKTEETIETIENVTDESSGTIEPDTTKPWFFQRWFTQNEQDEVRKTDINDQVDINQDSLISSAAQTQPVQELQELESLSDDILGVGEEEDVQLEDDVIDEPADDNLQAGLTEGSSQSEAKKFFLLRVFTEWKTFVQDYQSDYLKIKRLRNRCASGLLLIVLFCGLGGFIFRFTEGTFESFYKCGVKRVKRDFIDTLWGFSQYMPMEDWKAQARSKLMNFENELHVAHEAGSTSYSGQKSWSFLNAFVYSLTVVTTIGYGHISPVTATGRAITVVYAIIGIPMFLILLADFGKLFTRAMKFLWVFVRRIYYTGSCKKVRGTVPVQDMMKGVQAVYDFARRSSQMPGAETASGGNLPAQPEEAINVELSPETPAPSQFDIDDEFNLPISVAITILVTYIMVGATIYNIWEDWTFFECFYFVFISMSTIGFGDFVPNHPMFMMASMVYLVFGLALTSMCINVVQEKLSDTFKQASAKIGATMGLDVAEDDADAEVADTPDQTTAPIDSNNSEA